MSCGKKTLYGSRTSDSKIVGYCANHHVYLTAVQLKERECLRKKCRAFRKMDNPYWAGRERIKNVKRLKKEAGIPAWKKVEIKTNHKGEVIKIADK